MRRPPIRSHTAAFKPKAAPVAIRGDEPVAELANNFDVHATQIAQRKAEILKGAGAVFDSGMRPPDKPAHPNRLDASIRLSTYGYAISGLLSSESMRLRLDTLQDQGANGRSFPTSLIRSRVVCRARSTNARAVLGQTQDHSERRAVIHPLFDSLTHHICTSSPW